MTRSNVIVMVMGRKTSRHVERRILLVRKMDTMWTRRITDNGAPLPCPAAAESATFLVASAVV